MATGRPAASCACLAGIDNDALSQLPTLSKATLMERFDDIVTDRRLRRVDLEAHLSGPRREQPYGDHVVLSTSGSTGLRGIFVYPREMLGAGVASLLRAMVAMGATPSMRTIGIGAPSAVHVSRRGGRTGAGGVGRVTPP